MEQISPLEKQVNELRDLLEKGDTALRIIKGNAIIFYGTTGSGKSTLTSGCSGKKLISIINEDDEIEIQIQDQEKGITKIPVAMTRESTNEAPKNIYDTTGFNDIGGYPQEIANAFYNKRLIEITEQMKFVLVVDQYQINQNNGINFITAVNNFSAMFRNIELLKNGVAICISKVDKQFQIEYWRKKIDGIKNLSEKLTAQSKSVIEYTIDKLFIFRAPKEQGQEINCDELFYSIYNSIEYIDNTGENQNNLFNIAISDEAKKPAKQLFEESLNIFQDSLQYVAQKTQDKCNEINAPENAYQIVKEVIKYRREIIKKDLFLFEYDKEVIVEERVQEYHTRYKQVLDLDDMISLREHHDTVLGEQVTITQMQKCIEDMFRIFEKNVRDDQQKQELEVKQKNILQNLNFVRFLSQVCETATIQLDLIKEKFRTTQQSLKDAEQKGIDDIQVLPDGKSYQYYNKNYTFLNRNPYRSQRQHMNKMAFTQYSMGKIKFEEKEYDECAKHFKEAIMLSETKDCMLFTDIYDCISNIFDHQQDSLKTFQDQTIHQKLFGIYKNKFDENLEKLNNMIELIGDKNNISKYISKLEYLESINEIRIQLNKLSQFKNIDAQYYHIIKDFGILNQLVIQKFQNLNLVLGGEADTTEKSKKVIKNIQQKFEIYLNAQIFVNSLQSNEFQAQIQDWFSKVNPSFIKIKQNQRDVTREIDIVEKDLDQIIQFTNYLKNDRESKKILSEALFHKGMIKRKEGQKKYDQAIIFFNEALEVNKHLYKARRYIADCYFELKKYQEAIQFYKQIHQNEKIIECFELQKKERGNTVELAKEKAKFYQEIGLYEKAREVLTMEAISIISNSIEKSSIEQVNQTILEIENEIKQIQNPQNQPLISFILQSQESEIFSEEFVDQ